MKRVDEVWEYLCPRGCGGAMLGRGGPVGCESIAAELPLWIPCPECGELRPGVLKSRHTTLVNSV